MGVVSFLILSSLGLAITSQAQDCSKPDGGPNMSLGDNYINLQTFPDQSQVSFKCDVGYSSAGGSPVITCSAGEWSPVRLRCEKKNCGSAGEVDNGQIQYPSGTEFGAQAVVTCNAGYILVGKGTLNCGDKGWMERLPECEVVTCDPPGNIPGGSFSPILEIYDYRAVVIYKCRNQLTLNGSSALSCSEDGTFKPKPPICTKVECEDIVIQNAFFDGGSRRPYGFRSTVTFKCEPGYTMKGASTLTCDINSRWTPGKPECIENPTTRKPTTTTTTTKPPPPVVTKKPQASPPPRPTVPTGKGEGHQRPLIIVFSVLGVLLIVVGVILCVRRKIRRDRGRNTDKEATKDGEDVALS